MAINVTDILLVLEIQGLSKSSTVLVANAFIPEDKVLEIKTEYIIYVHLHTVLVKVHQETTQMKSLEHLKDVIYNGCLWCREIWYNAVYQELRTLISLDF